MEKMNFFMFNSFITSELTSDLVQFALKLPRIQCEFHIIFLPRNFHTGNPLCSGKSKATDTDCRFVDIQARSFWLRQQSSIAQVAHDTNSHIFNS